MSTATNPTNVSFNVNEHLNRLIKDTFNVVIEVRHEIYPTNSPRVTSSGKKYRAATTAYAFKSQADAIAWRDGKAAPIAVTMAKCSVNDTFVKSRGVTRVLNRLYKELKDKGI